MDDKIFFGAVVYMFLSISISGLLPSELYTGTRFVDTSDEFVGEYSEEDGAIQGTVEQLGFFRKAVRFFFVSWVIDGIPPAVGIIISLLNLMGVLISGKWIYDAVRGI